MSEFAPGDVLRYVPNQRHCREGMAIVHDDGRVLDTFWDSDRHLLNKEERATAEVVFNLNDFDALDLYGSAASLATWETYHRDDRACVTSQHGLQAALYIRKGATPDLGTQIANAEDKVEEAESGVRMAEWMLEGVRERLEELRQGLLACATAAGEDVSDGIPTWPDIVEWAVRAVREGREASEHDARAAEDEVERLRDALAAASLRGHNARVRENHYLAELEWLRDQIERCRAVDEGIAADRDEARAEVRRLREALRIIRDHGQTDDLPCHAIVDGDCVDFMRETARATLAALQQNHKPEGGAER